MLFGGFKKRPQMPDATPLSGISSSFCFPAGALSRLSHSPSTFQRTLGDSLHDVAQAWKPSGNRMYVHAVWLISERPQWRVR